MNNRRNICIFVGSGFSCALFKQETQATFINDFLNFDKVKNYLSDFVNDFKTINDIELVMSHYNNMAYSNLKLKKGGYGRKIISLRSALAIYYHEKYLIRKNTYEFNKCYKILFSKYFKKYKITKNNLFIVTTNYDLGVETFLNGIFGNNSYYYPQTYHFNSKNNDVHKIPIFKLHGSINWLEKRTYDCNNDLLDYVKPFKIQVHSLNNFSLKYYNRKHFLLNTNDELYSPVLIPFFFQKETWLGSRWDTIFDDIWNSAKEYMEQASTYLFLGYGLPSADHYIFSYLFNIFIKLENTNTSIIDIKPNTTLKNLFRTISNTSSCKNDISILDIGIKEYLEEYLFK